MPGEGLHFILTAIFRSVARSVKYRSISVRML